ncbi:hypothetical protein FJTKL_12733 [Diaporthe vaccinii]|uniref:Rhodopsin domain-containing protein n=1 Tax=Diaporthe vaccinii TaxID=105482 RepID=A0ABR4ECE5_9PEZI
MKITRKLSIISVFATGFLTCCTAIFRFVIRRLENQLSSPDVSNHTTQSIAWAIYYSYRAELVSCFVISCLPAVKQLIERKILPSVTGYTITLSSKLKGSRKDDAQKGVHSDGADEFTQDFGCPHKG